MPFEVEQVIHFRRFQSRAGHHKGPLRYLCFGQRDAAHLAHLVEGPPPDFDQVLQVETEGLDDVTDDQLRDGVVITVPDRSDEIDARLQPSEAISTKLEGGSAGGSASIELVVTSEYYFETGDLAAV